MRTCIPAEAVTRVFGELAARRIAVLGVRFGPASRITLITAEDPGICIAASSPGTRPPS